MGLNQGLHGPQPRATWASTKGPSLKFPHKGPIAVTLSDLNGLYCMPPTASLLHYKGNNNNINPHVPFPSSVTEPTLLYTGITQILNKSNPCYWITLVVNLRYLEICINMIIG